MSLRGGRSPRRHLRRRCVLVAVQVSNLLAFGDFARNRRLLRSTRNDMQMGDSSAPCAARLILFALLAALDEVRDFTARGDAGTFQRHRFRIVQ
jgi:hypothetical protein